MKKKILAAILTIALLVVIIPFSITPATAASGTTTVSPDDEIVWGPINVVPVIEVTTLTSERVPDMSAMEPGARIGVAAWRVKNLTKQPKYVFQNIWAETTGSEFLPLSLDYTIEVGKKTDSSQVFLIPASATAVITVTIYVAPDAQPCKAAKLHIQKPKLTLPPSGGKG
jgi:hypothetical protein